MRAGWKRSNPAATAVWVVKRLPARVTASATSKGCAARLHETACALQHGERRMAFIQVADFRLDAQRGEQSPSADPEHQFLHEAQLRPAAVKLAGDRRDKAGSSPHRCCPAGIASLCRPEPARRAARSGDPGTSSSQPQPLAVRLAQRRDRQLSGIVVGKEACCVAVLVDHLAKIALL